jgi:hypothetical protein
MAVRGSLTVTPLTTPLTSDNNGVLTARPPLPLKTPLDAGFFFLRYSVKNHFFTTFAT